MSGEIVKYYFVFILSLACFFNLHAQSQDSTAPVLKKKYICTLFSSPYSIIRDEGHSPLSYRGNSIQVSRYNERFRRKSITKLEFNVIFGILKTNPKEVDVLTEATYLRLDINYHYMVPLKSFFKGKIKWAAGAILTNSMDNRYYNFLTNNSYGYEYSNAINPAVQFAYDFQNNKSTRRYQAGFKLNFSLLAHVIRPNFIGMEPQQTYNQSTIKPLEIFVYGNTIALPNKFMRINTEIYLDRFILNSQSKVRFYYGWGMLIDQVSNPLYSAYHTLGFIRMIYSEKEKKRLSLKKLKLL